MAGSDRGVDADRLRAADAFDYLGSPDGIRWVAGFWFAIVFIEALDHAPIPLGGIAAFLLQFVTWFVLYRVASEVLLDASAETPGLTRSTFEGADSLALKHVGLWLLGTLLVAVLMHRFGTGGALLGAAALTLLLPAATILLTLGRRLLMALWPPAWLRLIDRIGARDYALLCGVLVGIGAVYAIASSVALALQPDGWLAPIVQFTIWSAGVLGWFHLAGRAVAVRRVELNLVESDKEPDAPVETFTRDPDTLWEEIRSRGGSRAMHAELARHLARDPDPSAVRDRRISHGRMHVEALLLAFEDPVEAVDRAAAMLEVDPGFSLSDAPNQFALFEAACEQRVKGPALRLAENFLARFANSPRAPKVKLRACELMADDESSRRTIAEAWFRELMVADLAEPEAERLRALKDRY